MNTGPEEYTVMGEDGQDYGPVAAEQIYAWIDEGRVGKKTPVMPTRAKDWVFLEMLPEFADAFDPSKPRTKPKPASKPGKKTWVMFVILLIILGLLFIAARQLNPH